MEDTLYDTSWTVHSILKPTPSLSRLLCLPASTPQARNQHRDRLASHAESFQRTLGKERPRYEREEEKEQLGGLKQCTWTQLHHALDDDQQPDVRVGGKRKRDAHDDEQLECDGLLVSLFYEKKTYKFIIYTTSSRSNAASKRSRIATSSHQSKNPADRPETAILLSKSSPAALKSLLEYLSGTFSLTNIHPLKLSTTFLQTSLEKYLTLTTLSLWTAYADNATRRDKLHRVLSTLKLTISFSAPIAPSLRSIEVAIPAQTVSQHYKHVLAAKEEDRPAAFMGALAGWILNKTGFHIAPPMQSDDLGRKKENEQQIGTVDPSPELREASPAPDRVAETVVEKTKGPMRISRISNGSWALSMDGKIKFSMKAVDVVADAGDEMGSCVKRANADMLAGVVEEARRQIGEEG